VRRLRRDPLGLFAELARRDPGIAEMRLGRHPFFLVCDPVLVGAVLVERSREFASETIAWGGVRAKPPSPPPFGLLRSSDPLVHREARRMLQPAFSRARLAACGSELARYVDESASRWQHGTVVDGTRWMTRLTIELLARSLFGTRLGGRAEPLVDDLETLLGAMETVTSWSADTADLVHLRRLARLRDAHERVREFCAELLAEKRDEGGETVIAALVAAGGGLDDDALTAEVFLVLLAGFKTTASALAWAWSLLAEHPAIEARVQAEADRELGDLPPAGDPLPELPFARAVFTETIRLYPPSWYIGRYAVETLELGGREIPAGASVWISPFVLHHDPRWFARAETFEPDRWLGEPDTDRPRWAFIPFGAGARRCLGETLAWAELAAVLPVIARRWRLRAVDPGRPRALPGPTLRAEGGPRLTLARR